MASRVMAPAPALVCVAAVAGAHGVRGALRLRCFTADPASVAAYGPVRDREGRELFELTVIGRARDGVIATAGGIASRAQAEALRGVELFVPRASLPEPDEDEFYYADLIGLAVVDRAGAERGEVAAVTNHGAGDVLEIVDPQGRSHLLPFTRAAVPEIDLARRRIVIDPPVERPWEGAAA
jgi:16S rRNA processing protein RimM